MIAGIGFCVIYRMKVRSGSEEQFREAWTRLTRVIRDQRSGLGSRLHLAEDGWWVAYAQWPSRDAWERAQQMESADEEATKMLADSVEDRMPPILIEPVIDMLVVP